MSQLKKILSKVLEIDESKITDETSPKTTPSWDSFNALLLVSELEKEFNVKFTMEEVTAVKCVRDIKEALHKHNVRVEEQ